MWVILVTVAQAGHRLASECLCGFGLCLVLGESVTEDVCEL